MTSPAAETPAQTAARHRAQISGLRRWTRIVLIVGTVASLACAAGPIWLVRLGLVPALAAALVSCWLAWREIGLERRAHAAAMLAASRRHGAQLSEERRQHGAVLIAMTGRVEAYDTLAASRAATIHRLGAEIARLTGDVNGLRGANGRLTRDLNFRDAAIGELREAIARKEAELAALQPAEPVEQRRAETPDAAAPEPAERRSAATPDVGGPGAEIHRLPSRARVSDPAADVPDEDAVLENGAERRTAEFLDAELVSMPNYEEDRRFA